MIKFSLKYLFIFIHFYQFFCDILLGTGRLGIGLYVLFIEKWLEIFDRPQFLILKMEDYDENPKDQMKRVFEFLDLPTDSNILEKSISGNTANVHKIQREPMLPETREMLEKFYAVYNKLLTRYLQDENFLYSDNDLSKGGWENPLKIPSKKIDDVKFTPFHPQRRGVDGEKKKWVSLTNDIIPPEEQALLPQPKRPPSQFFEEYLEDYVHDEIDRLSPARVGQIMCLATFSIDLAAVKEMISHYKLSPKEVNTKDLSRTPLHCLSLAYIYSDSSSHSYIFSVLRNVPSVDIPDSWLSKILSPPLKDYHSPSPSRKEIMNSLSHDIVDIFKVWCIICILPFSHFFVFFVDVVLLCYM